MSNRWKIRNLWILTLAADVTAVVTAYYTTLLVRFYSAGGQALFTAVNRVLGVRETGSLGDRLEYFYMGSGPRIVLIVAATVCLLYALFDLYPGRRFLRPRPEAWHILLANVLALLLFFTYFYLRRNTWHPRSFFVTLLFFNTVYAALFRAGVDRLLRGLRRLGADRCPALLIGAGDEASFLDVLIGELHPHGIHVAARLRRDPAEPFDALLNRIEREARRHAVDLVIAADPSLTTGEIMQLLERADRLGASVKVLSGEFNILVNRAQLPADIVRNTPLVHFEAPRGGAVARVARRLLAFAAALCALLLLLPLLALIALLVALSSRGPAFFKQERIGVNRQPFRIYKFRTMYDKAAELQAQVEEFNESGRGLFKIRRDPRVTPVGRFLRRFSLDELPQLWNVLRGEMVLVGPRPLPRRDFENYYEEWHYSRHRGMPGLTCLWQVSGRSDLDFHNMCILDVYYLRNRNWILDLKILLRTAWVVLFAKGAY
ncbi:MAG: exopolysaccharide biosynthesis polyprenyl glycosylphosphotransferase [Lentisphaerae bacterium]|nr:exopolysaccharide biosynthesis polyprenyl glycosylphosphotransferase [Lentisphaerota bacterium]